MRPLTIVSLACALAASGCSSLLDADAGLADHALVSVTGESAVPLLLITSTNFSAVRDRATGAVTTTLVTADTVHVRSLPHASSYRISGRDRFLVRLVNPDADVTATVHLQVQLDRNLAYTERATLRDASLQYFTYFQPW